MPSSDRIEPPATAHAQAPAEGPSQGCGAAGLQHKLEAIAGQIGDADRRHREALQDMQDRLAQFGRQVEEARAGLPELQGGALGRIEEGIAGLSQRIATFARQRQSHRAVGGRAVSASVPGDADEPWDAQSAEALTRVYEMASAEQHRGASAPSRQPRPARPEAKPQPAREPAVSQAWLEARLADIAAVLQQALTASSPARALAVLDRRLDQFEQRLDATLANRPASIGREDLVVIEAHVKELTERFEATSRQLARLDAIDGRLQVLGRALEEQILHPAPPERYSDEAIASLVDTAAERAASRLAASLPTPPPAPEVPGQARFEMLEGLLQDHIAERRRSEEVTTGILHAIEDALIRIVDRVDAMEQERVASAPHQDEEAAGRSAVAAESARLAEAYATGARVLGQKPIGRGPEATLDAADYAPSSRGADPASRADAAVSSAGSATAAEQAQARQELRASAMRAKLKAQAKADEPPAADASLGELKPGAGTSARTKAPAVRSVRRFTPVLGLAAALMFGAGYLAVDVFLMRAPATAVPQETAAPRPATPQSAGPMESQPQQSGAKTQPASATEAETRDPAGASTIEKAQPVPAPVPAQRRHVPETVTDDLSEGETLPQRRRAELEVPGRIVVWRLPAANPAAGNAD